MTAFLNIDVLRAHTVPEGSREVLRLADVSRPVLVARWLIAPDGQLVRRWRTGDRAADVPPD